MSTVRLSIRADASPMVRSITFIQKAMAGERPHTDDMNAMVDDLVRVGAIRDVEMVHYRMKAAYSRVTEAYEKMALSFLSASEAVNRLTTAHRELGKKSRHVGRANLFAPYGRHS